MRAAILAAVLIALGGSAFAQSPLLVAKTSANDVPATVAKLEAAIAKRGATVVAKVDHAAAAKANGLALNPAVLVIFGNPKLGTPLMQASPTAGLDLPMRVLVWQAADGAVKLGYWAPAAMAQQHAIAGRDEVLKTMAGALDAITAEAAAK